MFSSSLLFGDDLLWVKGRVLHKLVIVKSAIVCATTTNRWRRAEIADGFEVVTQRRDTGLAQVPQQHTPCFDFFVTVG